MNTNMTYAGIGARETPKAMLQSMIDVGAQLAISGWTLRSGYANGADQAFGFGADDVGGSWQMHLPWECYNDAPSCAADPRFLVPTWTPEIVGIASEHHPNWERLTDPVKLLMARNTSIVLGEHLDDPVSCVICWTPFGKMVGGTAHAMRVAAAYEVPVFNLYHEYDQRALVEFVAAVEEQQRITTSDLIFEHIKN